ncbi:MAG: methyltransferase domain-containing protein [Nocardioides sp.]
MSIALPSVTVSEVFGSALRGEPCLVIVDEDDHHASLLPTQTWLRDADADDRSLLELCVGPTVDIGCGPGRMAAAIAGSGRPVLGIDIVPEAVRMSVGRGVSALLRDVFGPVPGEGRWATALLADGNIGIGGDPVALLQRLREVIAPTGRVVVEVAPPGTGVHTRHVRLESAVGRSEHFPWTLVGLDAIEAVAQAAGLRLRDSHRHGRRFSAVLEAP